MKITQLFLLFSCILLASCGNPTALNNEHSEQNPTVNLIQTSDQSSQVLANQVKTELQTKMDFNALYVVNSDSKIVVAIEPMLHDRFQLKSLRQKTESLLKDKISSREIEVSTDKKIAIETEKLEEKIAKKSISQKELDKELSRIIKLSKEET